MGKSIASKALSKLKSKQTINTLKTDNLRLVREKKSCRHDFLFKEEVAIATSTYSSSPLFSVYCLPLFQYCIAGWAGIGA